jgi:hypothetical protein
VITKEGASLFERGGKNNSYLCVKKKENPDGFLSMKDFHREVTVEMHRDSGYQMPPADFYTPNGR